MKKKKQIIESTNCHTGFYHDVKQKFIELVDDHRNENGRHFWAYTQTFKYSKLNDAPFSVQHKYKSSDVFTILNDVANFVITPEPHASGAIHYHGIIISLKKGKTKEYFEKTIPALKKLGAPTLKKITDLSQWIDYCFTDTEDFAYLKKDYLTYNQVIKYVPKNHNANTINKQINSMLSFDFKIKKFRMKALSEKKKGLSNEYKILRQTLELKTHPSLHDAFYPVRRAKLGYIQELHKVFYETQYKDGNEHYPPYDAPL